MRVDFLETFRKLESSRRQAPQLSRSTDGTQELIFVFLSVLSAHCCPLLAHVYLSRLRILIVYGVRRPTGSKNDARNENNAI